MPGCRCDRGGLCQVGNARLPGHTICIWHCMYTAVLVLSRGVAVLKAGMRVGTGLVRRISLASSTLWVKIVGENKGKWCKTVFLGHT